MKQKALIHIGAGFMQLPGIIYAKKLGLYLVITDRNYNAPGVKLADRYENIDGADVESFIKIASEVSEEYDLVGAFSSSDYGVMVVAELAEIYSFPFASKDSSSTCLNKNKSKKIWQENGLPVPNGFVVNTVNELNGIVSNLGYPFIIKPVDSCGSKGIKSVWEESELIDAFNLAHAISNDVVVEEIVKGNHCDVNGLFINDDFHRCGILDRYFSAPPYHYPVYGIQPSLLSDEQESDVYKLVESAAKIVGINNGPVKADVIYTINGPVLLELTPRFHGDVSTQHVSPYAIGFNPVELWLEILCGKSLKIVSHEEYYSGWKALFANDSGSIQSIEGVSDALEILDVTDVYISKSIGDYVPPAIDNTAMCGFIWAHAKELDVLLFNLEKAASMINIKVQ